MAILKCGLMWCKFIIKTFSYANVYTLGLPSEGSVGEMQVTRKAEGTWGGREHHSKSKKETIISKTTTAHNIRCWGGQVLIWKAFVFPEERMEKRWEKHGHSKEINEEDIWHKKGTDSQGKYSHQGSAINISFSFKPWMCKLEINIFDTHLLFYNCSCYMS